MKPCKRGRECLQYANQSSKNITQSIIQHHYLLHGVQVVAPDVPVHGGRLHRGVVHHTVRSFLKQ